MAIPEPLNPRLTALPFLQSTGAKMLLALTVALLPLGVLALVASLQSMRTADKEKGALLLMAAKQSARRLAAELSSDQAALRLMSNALSSGRADPNHCARMDAFLRSRSRPDTLFVVYRRDGGVVCSSLAPPPAPIPEALRFQPASAELLPDRGLLMTRTPSTDGRVVALALYDHGYLEQITDPAMALDQRHVLLEQEGKVLDLGGALTSRDRASVASVSAPVDAMGITLTMIVRDPPATLTRTLALFLPLLMWFAAAVVAWIVVNRLLVRPLVELRRVVSGYRPGEVLEPLRRMRTPAREIAALGETFRDMSEEVATHEAEMAEGLERQRKLTREVHHRVKNNLQIIASLISLHARSAGSAAATDAYSSIQRRVDALSVVHRNHYAELEENRGVGIRALVSELSASLRATAPEGSKLVIQVDSDNLHVSQDVAVPVAFLITELVELAMLSNSTAVVRISVKKAEDTGRAILKVASPALRASPEMLHHLEQRFGRVLTGLSRQLRTPLDYDEAEGAYAIGIGVND